MLFYSVQKYAVYQCWCECHLFHTGGASLQFTIRLSHSHHLIPLLSADVLSIPFHMHTFYQKSYQITIQSFNQVKLPSHYLYSLVVSRRRPFSSFTVQIQLIKTTPHTWKITGSWGFCGLVPPGHYHATPVVLQWCLGSLDYSGAVSPSVKNLKCFPWIRFVFKQYVIAYREKIVIVTI